MKLFTWICYLACWGVLPMNAASYLPVSEANEVEKAAGVFVGKLTGREVVEREGGALHTRALFEVEQVVKGTFAPNVVITHRGGALGNRAELAGDAPQFLIGQRYLLCVREGVGNEAALCLGGRSVRQLACVEGELGLEATLCVRRFRRLAGEAWGGVFPRATFPEVKRGVESEEERFVQEYEAVTGLNQFRIPAGEPPRPVRFTRADLGDAIPYIVDKDALPAGLSEEEAMGALERALAAWTEVTGIVFQPAGFASFGRPASDVPSDEEQLRIQFHDLYNRITSEATLGVGGASATNGTFDGGGAGGRVFDTEFHRTTSGYVVMDHTKPTLGDPVNFEEVLCHEIGHALGLAHSSEDENETDAKKREAIMYFRTHTDGRGASVRAWDRETIRQSFPEGNLPPQGSDGYMDIVTRPNGWGLSQAVNTLTLRGRDRDSASESLTLALTPTTSNMNGRFSLVGNELSFTPAGFFNVAFQYDIGSNGFYDRATLRFDDGVHGSPLVRVRVLSFQSDTSPNGTSDGLPNAWVADHFGSDPDPAGDADGDGLSNVAEFLQRTDPQDAGSSVSVSFDQTNPLSVAEGTLVVLPVKVTGTPFREVVTPVTLGGSATAGEDYTLLTGERAVIPPGVSDTRVVLQVQVDTEAEPDETITLALGDVVDGLGALGSSSTLTLTITGEALAEPSLARLGDVRVAADQLYLSWIGDEGRDYVLERSSDLAEWNRVESLVGSGSWGEVSVGLDEAPSFLRIRSE